MGLSYITTKMSYFKCKFSTQILNFVPKHLPAQQSDIDLLKNFIKSHNNLLILTGAGISTESGIPDYRSEEVGLYARSNHKPIQYQDFVKSESVRKRYWARNYIGWPRFSNRTPNKTHYCIRDLEVLHRKVSVVVTQNVDSLHQKAGSSNVIELHGSAFRVNCMKCPKVYDRSDVQTDLRELNPELPLTTGAIRPDGDVEIDNKWLETFRPPLCRACGGVLKPDIVFFGDNVPRSRVEAVRQGVSESDGLLVLGTSLSVFSSYRIVLQAVDERKEVAVLNIGKTRADGLVGVKVAARCGDVMPKTRDGASGKVIIKAKLVRLELFLDEL